MARLLDLDEVKTLDKYKRHTIEVVVDRLVVRHADDDGQPYGPRHPNPESGRFADSVETALRLGEGVMVVAPADAGAFEEQRYSERYSCAFDGTTIDELEPRSFSFNSPHGACPACTGLGVRMEFDAERITNRRLSISEGALLPWSRMTMTDSWYGKVVEAVAKRRGFKTDVPLEKLDRTRTCTTCCMRHAARRCASATATTATPTTTRRPSKACCPTSSGATARPTRSGSSRSSRSSWSPGRVPPAAARGSSRRR